MTIIIKLDDYRLCNGCPFLPDDWSEARCNMGYWDEIMNHLYWRNIKTKEVDGTAPKDKDEDNMKEMVIGRPIICIENHGN